MKTVGGWAAMLFAGAICTGCGADPGPPLSASGVEIIAPLPGRAASVAYMTLHNGSREPVVVREVASPAFREAQMHETVLEDGVARMVSIPSLTIEADSAVTFEPGGKHIMLLEPKRALLPGADIALELRYGDGGILLLTSPLLTRGVDSQSN